MIHDLHRNPLLGVLNLIDRGRDWPSMLDVDGVAALHAAAGGLLTLLRCHQEAKTPEELAAPWRLDLNPGRTPELRCAQALATGGRYARLVLKVADLGASPEADALETVLVAGMACRDSLAPFDPGGPLYENVENWEERLEAAARWSVAALDERAPRPGRLGELMMQTGWTIAASDTAPAGVNPATSRTVYVQPRLGGAFDHRGRPTEEDRIVVATGPGDRDRGMEFNVNGRPHTWPQLCQVMTSGDWLPVPEPGA